MLTRSQRLLLELQKLTDENTRLRECVAAYRPLVEAVTRHDFQQAALLAPDCQPYLGQLKAPLKQRHFTPEFKAEAAKMLIEAAPGTRALIMRKLNVSSAQAYGWVRHVQAGKAFKQPKNRPDVYVPGTVNEDTKQKLEAAKAAFSSVWQGGSRRNSMVPVAASATLPDQATASSRRLVRAVARKNGNPFRRL